MVRFSLAEARALGITPSPKKNSTTKLQLVKWDAKVVANSVWMQIPDTPPSLNIWKNWHWAKQYQYKEELKYNVAKLALAFKLPKFEKVVIEITYYFSTNRRRDPADNYAPKFLLDALVTAGVLTDDNGELITVLPPHIKVDKEQPRTEVVIRRVV